MLCYITRRNDWVNHLNNLMNKPGRYIAKLDFAITTLGQYRDVRPTGGSIEIFRKKADARSRKDYIDDIGKSIPLLSESSEIVRSIILIRIDGQITGSEAQKYFAAARKNSLQIYDRISDIIGIFRNTFFAMFLLILLIIACIKYVRNCFITHE